MILVTEFLNKFKNYKILKDFVDVSPCLHFQSKRR